MSVTWGSMGLEKHQDSWELAKRATGVTDVRSLSSQKFQDLIQLAEQIRKGNVNVAAL